MKKKQPKPQQKGNTLQVNVPVNFNIVDEDEKMDLEFLESKGKRATKIKEWLRAWRLGEVPDVAEWKKRYAEFSESLKRGKKMADDRQESFQLPEMDEDEALNSMF